MESTTLKIENIKNPLRRDGNSQAQRGIDAQKPTSAPVDGRSVWDILNFLGRFAQEVNYYQLITDRETGQELAGVIRDWTPFFQNSVPFRLATIAQFDYETWWATYQTLRSKNTDTAQYSRVGELNVLMNHLHQAFAQHQAWHIGLLEDESEVSIAVKNLTETNVKFILQEFIGIHNTLKLKYGFKPQQVVHTFFASPIWRFSSETLLQLDPELKTKRGNLETILPTLLPRLDRIAELLYKTQRAIGTTFLTFDTEKLIAETGKHEAHIGLLLAFLRIFKYVQGDLNQLTERHLNHFYRNVLLFQEKTAVPDQAHVVFELAKHITDTHVLTQGTAFKDGKDKNKAEIIFNLDKEVALNQAAVAHVRTLYVDNQPFIFQQEGGESKTNWASFGEKPTQGRVGFIIAASVLRMREGERKITLEFSAPPPLSISGNIDLSTVLEIDFTTKDKWLPATLESNPIFKVNNPHLSIIITFKKEDKPIEPLTDPKLNTWGITEPMLRVNFKLDKINDLETRGKIYEALTTMNLLAPTLKVEVKGIKSHLKVQNDEGVIDALKPFRPFGVTTTSSFYIGSEEVFSKNLTVLKLDGLVWEKIKVKEGGVDIERDVNDTNITNHYALYNKKYNPARKAEHYQAKSYLLKNTQWSDLSKTDFHVFSTSWDILSGGTWQLSERRDDISFFIPNVTLDSYVKIQNRVGEFFYDKYAELLNIQALAIAKQQGSSPEKVNDAIYKLGTNYLLGSEITLDLTKPVDAANFRSNYKVEVPNAPYLPILNDFTLTYEATATDIELIHLHPYEDGFQIFKNNAIFTQTLIPVFKKISTVDGVEIVKDVGNLYIGLKNAQADSNVSLLFQFAEYTGNSDLKLPDITWYCLRDNNQWGDALQNFIDYQDDTDGLAQSGVITFELPENAATNPTILPAGHHWLKASVGSNVAAFDRLIAIHAQAGKAIFTPSVQSDLERLNTPLLEKSIAKAVVENGAVAKIMQPYPSFGGMIPEKGDAFYRRISEHLRHKGRAVSIWDYEALILQTFPQIYKVKCLNHTQGLRELPYDIEVKPCHTTLVVVPDVRQLPQAQRARPKATQKLLKAIDEFLSDRKSPFAEIQVLNPRYEDVNVTFNVVFRAGKDDNYYKKQLEKDLVGFLSPWTIDTENNEIQFGGEMYASSVLRFVEMRDYVDYVSDFNLCPTDKSMFDANNIFQWSLVNDSFFTQVIKAQTARSVLASGHFNITADALC